jgi:hypothetical protein
MVSFKNFILAIEAKGLVNGFKFWTQTGPQILGCNPVP